jgi:hypothetical protein
VLHHRGQRHRKGLRQFADRGVALGELRQNRAPRRIRERCEGAVEMGLHGCHRQTSTVIRRVISLMRAVSFSTPWAGFIGLFLLLLGKIDT